MAHIFPSLIAGDLLNLQKQITLLDPYVDGYHLDIMDNHFVPNLTWGPMFINAIAQATYRTIWIHLMVENPTEWVNLLSLPPGSIYTFHIEAEKEIPKLIKRIKEKKWNVSIAISPGTSVEQMFPLLNTLDQVLIMSVEPGFSGQDFLPKMVTKVEKLAAYRDTSGASFQIGIDGGVTESNINMLVKKGVNDFAIGNSILKAKNPVKKLEELRSLIK